jgi:hypothetical protein
MVNGEEVWLEEFSLCEQVCPRGEVVMLSVQYLLKGCKLGKKYRVIMFKRIPEGTRVRPCCR